MNYCFDFIETPIIKLFVLDSSEGIHFLIKGNDKRIKTIMNLYNPTKGLKLKKANVLINSFLKGKISTQKNIKIKFLDGTTLQKKVWTEISKIPYGHTISYSELAKKIKRPDAVRAIASMVGKNPVGLLVPCHRVVKKNGNIGGYMWGANIKRKILDIEGRGMADSTYRGGKWDTESAPAWMLTEH